MRTKTFYENRDCFEVKGIKHYCSEFDNIYCPRTCSYAMNKMEKKEKLNRLKYIADVYSDGKLVRKVFK